MILSDTLTLSIARLLYERIDSSSSPPFDNPFQEVQWQLENREKFFGEGPNQASIVAASKSFSHESLESLNSINNAISLLFKSSIQYNLISSLVCAKISCSTCGMFYSSEQLPMIRLESSYTKSFPLSIAQKLSSIFEGDSSASGATSIIKEPCSKCSGPLTKKPFSCIELFDDQVSHVCIGFDDSFIEAPSTLKPIEISQNVSFPVIFKDDITSSPVDRALKPATASELRKGRLVALVCHGSDGFSILFRQSSADITTERVEWSLYRPGIPSLIQVKERKVNTYLSERGHSLGKLCGEVCMVVYALSSPTLSPRPLIDPDIPPLGLGSRTSSTPSTKPPNPYGSVGPDTTVFEEVQGYHGSASSTSHRPPRSSHSRYGSRGGAGSRRPSTMSQFITDHDIDRVMADGGGTDTEMGGSSYRSGPNVAGSPYISMRNTREDLTTHPAINEVVSLGRHDCNCFDFIFEETSGRIICMIVTIILFLLLSILSIVMMVSLASLRQELNQKFADTLEIDSIIVSSLTVKDSLTVTSLSAPDSASLSISSPLEVDSITVADISITSTLSTASFEAYDAVVTHSFESNSNTFDSITVTTAAIDSLTMSSLETDSLTVTSLSAPDSASLSISSPLEVDSITVADISITSTLSTASFEALELTVDTINATTANITDENVTNYNVDAISVADASNLSGIVIEDAEYVGILHVENMEVSSTITSTYLEISSLTVSGSAIFNGGLTSAGTIQGTTLAATVEITAPDIYIDDTLTVDSFKSSSGTITRLVSLDSLVVDGTMQMTNLSVTGSIYGGTLNITSDASIGGDTITSGLQVSDSTTFGDVTCDNITLTDGGVVTSDSVVTSALTVNGDSTITGALEAFSVDATDTLTALNNVDINYEPWTSGTFTVTDLIVDNSLTAVDGVFTTLEVTGGSSLSGDVTIADNLTVVNDASIGNELTVEAGIIVTTNGVSVTDGGIDIDAGGLAVAGGVSVESGNVTVDVGNLVVSTGFALVAAGLTVTGDALMNNNLTVVGTITGNSDLAITGSISGESLSVVDITTTGAIDIGTDLTVAGDTTVDTFTASSISGETATLSSTLTVTGDITTAATLNAEYASVSETILGKKLSVTDTIAGHTITGYSTEVDYLTVDYEATIADLTVSNTAIINTVKATSMEVSSSVSMEVLSITNVVAEQLSVTGSASISSLSISGTGLSTNSITADEVNVSEVLVAPYIVAWQGLGVVSDESLLGDSLEYISKASFITAGEASNTLHINGTSLYSPPPRNTNITPVPSSTKFDNCLFDSAFNHTTLDDGITLGLCTVESSTYGRLRLQRCKDRACSASVQIDAPFFVNLDSGHNPVSIFTDSTNHYPTLSLVNNEGKALATRCEDIYCSSIPAGVTLLDLASNPVESVASMESSGAPLFVFYTSYANILYVVSCETGSDTFCNTKVSITLKQFTSGSTYSTLASGSEVELGISQYNHASGLPVVAVQPNSISPTFFICSDSTCSSGATEYTLTATTTDCAPRIIDSLDAMYVYCLDTSSQLLYLRSIVNDTVSDTVSINMNGYVDGILSQKHFIFIPRFYEGVGGASSSGTLTSRAGILSLHDMSPDPAELRVSYLNPELSAIDGSGLMYKLDSDYTLEEDAVLFESGGSIFVTTTHDANDFVDDGIAFGHVAEELIPAKGKIVPKLKQNAQFHIQKKKNLEIVFSALARKRFPASKYNVMEIDVVELMDDLVERFIISRIKLSKLKGQSALLEWAKEVTERYRHVNIENFTVSFADGWALTCLLHFFSPQLVDLDKCTKLSNSTRIHQIISTLHQKCGVPPIITARDFSDPIPHKVMVFYVSLIFLRFKRFRPASLQCLQVSHLMRLLVERDMNERDFETLGHEVGKNMDDTISILNSIVKGKLPPGMKMKDIWRIVQEMTELEDEEEDASPGEAEGGDVPKKKKFKSHGEELS
ncbi:hypothetical protein ADUPG1_012512, partial [Aduncisulcus paluster]